MEAAIGDEAVQYPHIQVEIARVTRVSAAGQLVPSNFEHRCPQSRLESHKTRKFPSQDKMLASGKAIRQSAIPL
jgi:hypothetical protein